MSRWKAAAIHLLISLLVATAVLAVMLLYWYPPEYFAASQAEGLLTILILVDVTVGPLLTLIIFRSGKPGLGFDLTAIGVLQVAALVYGLSVMWVARPVFLVFSEDEFHLVFAKDIEDEDLQRARDPQFAQLPRTGPRLVGAVPYQQDDPLGGLLSSLARGTEVPLLPENFVPFEALAEVAIALGRDLSLVIEKHPEADDELSGLVAESGLSPDQVVVLPLVARGQAMSVLLNRQDASLVAVVSRSL